VADASLTFFARSRSSVRVRWILYALLVVGIAGVALRIEGYSTRLFWTDEAITALRTAGYTGAQFTAAMQNGRPHTVTDVMHYAGRGSDRPIRDVVHSLALEDAQHPPVYYVITAVWTRIAGASIASLRLPALIFGMLLPFAAGWLCFELYGTRYGALLGFALSAVSPVFVIYSQQAREYGLWAVCMALSTALLLRAERTGARGWWILYAICGVASLYADVLFATVLISHAIYAAWRLRGAQLRAFAISAGISVIAFIPWAIVMYEGRRAIELSNAWTAGPWPLMMLLEKWVFNAGTTFFDLEYAHAILAIVLLPVFMLLAIAIIWNVAYAPERPRIMMTAMLAVPVVLLFLPDLVLHEHRSSVTRYGFALWLSFIICVAGFLASRLQRRAKIVLWSAISALLLVVELSSSAVDVGSPSWWDNHQDQTLPGVARVVNRTPSPLLVAPGRWARILDLSFYLDPNVRILFVPSHAVVRPALQSPTFLIGIQQDADAYERTFGNSALQFAYAGNESNAQVRRFRNQAQDLDALSLWRFR
jgi:uncharacterized membrane protein